MGADIQRRSGANVRGYLQKYKRMEDKLIQRRTRFFCPSILFFMPEKDCYTTGRKHPVKGTGPEPVFIIRKLHSVESKKTFSLVSGRMDTLNQRIRFFVKVSFDSKHS